MTTAARPDPFPTSKYDDLPRSLRAALTREARAVSALRVYRRRGWNPSAALAERERARLAVVAELDALEQAEMNPRLF